MRPALLSRLRVAEGDTVSVTEAPEGVVLTPYDPSVAVQAGAGRRFAAVPARADGTGSQDDCAAWLRLPSAGRPSTP